MMSGAMRPMQDFKKIQILDPVGRIVLNKFSRSLFKYLAYNSLLQSLLPSDTPNHPIPQGFIHIDTPSQTQPTVVTRFANLWPFHQTVFKGIVTTSPKEGALGSLQDASHFARNLKDWHSVHRDGSQGKLNESDPTNKGKTTSFPSSELSLHTVHNFSSLTKEGHTNIFTWKVVLLKA